MYKILIFSLLIIFGVLFGTEYTKPPVEIRPPEDLSSEVRVVSVIDGDTIIVDTPSGQETVRLIGIDTPETDPNRGGPECYGKEASDFTRSLLENSLVRLEADPSQGDRDTYGRLLRFVFAHDGTHVNQTLLGQGYAKEFTYNKPYRYQKEFKIAEATAQEALAGIWSCK